jgi:peptidoglycan/xylan/chitin deacetylase (PgdA/CDA1 family)
MLSRITFAFLASASLLGSTLANDAKPKQTVLISFDGAHDNRQWQRSLALSKETGAKFTYFLSCVYLLAPKNKGQYQPPTVAPARSNVGFGQSKADVSARLTNIWRAHLSGQEIASHGCGHFDGAKWSAKDWTHEFAEYDRIVANAWAINGDPTPFGWREAATQFANGFRAPYLATGKGLETALQRGGFAYDASSVSRGITPIAVKQGIARFALPLIEEGQNQRRIVSMDYNLFVRHSGGFERHDVGGAFEQRTYEMLKATFEQQYNAGRLPVQFGLHFTLMNGGAYWRAAERFVREVCVKPDVDCTTYSAYAAGLKQDEVKLRPALVSSQ